MKNMPNTPLLLLKDLKSDGLVRLEALKKLAAQNEVGEDAISVVLDQLERGRSFACDSLAKIVIKAGSESLYVAAKAILFRDHWALLELHRHEFSDPAIEARLCEVLCDVAHVNHNPVRRYIVESLRDHGSSAAVPVLKEILFDLLPTRDVKKIFADALERIGTVDIDSLYQLTETRSLQEFIVLIDSALIASQQRTACVIIPPGDSSTHKLLSDEGDTQDEVIKRVLEHKNKSWEYLDQDNESALNRARKAIEAICKDVYRLKGLENNNKSAKDLSKNFDDLVRTLEKNGLPDLIIIAIRDIQAHGNFGSHDQDEATRDLSHVHVRPVLMQLNYVVDWFKEFRLQALAEGKDISIGRLPESISDGDLT